MDDEFEPLAMKISDICKKNEIDFKWHHDDRSCCYILRFKKKNEHMNVLISEKNIWLKPSGAIKAEIICKIRELIKWAEMKNEEWIIG